MTRGSDISGQDGEQEQLDVNARQSVQPSIVPVNTIGKLGRAGRSVAARDLLSDRASLRRVSLDLQGQHTAGRQSYDVPSPCVDFATCAAADVLSTISTLAAKPSGLGGATARPRREPPLPTSVDAHEYADVP